MIHPASTPTRPLKEPILNSPSDFPLVESNLEFLLDFSAAFDTADSSSLLWSFFTVSVEPLSPGFCYSLSSCSFFSAGTSAWLLPVGPLRASVFILFHAARPHLWLILPPKCINDPHVFISSLDFYHKHKNQAFSIGTSNSTPWQTPFSSRLIRGPGIWSMLRSYGPKVDLREVWTGPQAHPLALKSKEWSKN